MVFAFIGIFVVVAAIILVAVYIPPYLNNNNSKSNVPVIMPIIDNDNRHDSVRAYLLSCILTWVTAGCLMIIYDNYGNYDKIIKKVRLSVKRVNSVGFILFMLYIVSALFVPFNQAMIPILLTACMLFVCFMSYMYKHDDEEI